MQVNATQKGYTCPADQGQQCIAPLDNPDYGFNGFDNYGEALLYMMQVDHSCIPSSKARAAFQELPGEPGRHGEASVNLAQNVVSLDYLVLLDQAANPGIDGCSAVLAQQATTRLAAVTVAFASP